ncbi:HAMP domain-containing sensor histidine kinase [Reyranella sp.]|uniref:sensor histidine kinase n=1 Tax=Reyranella sp. TaxID=1929291 RepID=UPI003BAA944F
MIRLNFAARIATIVAVGVMVAWIGAIVLYYWSQGLEQQAVRPPPSQIAALVEVLERTPSADRQGVLDAVTTRSLHARLEKEDLQVGPGDRTDLPKSEAWQAYAASLGDRHFAVASVLAAALSPAPRPFAGSANAFEIRVRLRTGETLVVDARSPIAVTEIGLPLGLGAGLLGTLIAFAALVVMFRETRPLARLAAAVDRMDPAGEPVPVPKAPGSAPEIQVLIAAFNRLQARLSHLLRARMAMLGGISHDVRTFATRLRLRVDQIPDRTERDRAIGDISDMIRLLDDGILASRAGVGELAEELVEFDEIVRAEVEDKRATGAPIDLRLAPEASGAVVLGDRLALRRVVGNLVDNALKYGCAAHLSLAVEAGRLVLAVDDRGPGIPSHMRDILLEPFVRLEGSRNRRTGGAGLGLAITRSLVEAHGGTVVIGDAPAGGARLVVRLPVFNAS